MTADPAINNVNQCVQPFIGFFLRFDEFLYLEADPVDSIRQDHLGGEQLAKLTVPLVPLLPKFFPGPAILFLKLLLKLGLAGQQFHQIVRNQPKDPFNSVHARFFVRHIDLVTPTPVFSHVNGLWDNEICWTALPCMAHGNTI